MAWRRGTCWLLIVFLTSGLTACTDEPPPDDTGAATAPVIIPGRPGEPASTIPRDQASPAPVQPPNEADFAFIEGMIVHHQQALEMTALVPERAASEQVKGLADRIADTQQAEIGGLNGWLRQKGRPTVDPSAPGHAGHTTMPGMATPEQLNQLRAATGTAFDRLFLQLMITHHEGALTMVRQVQTSGVDVRVQELADDIAVTQTDEIHRMQGMLGG